MDATPAAFKTVCGALLRRPGCVRFPSIPPNSVRITAKMKPSSGIRRLAPTIARLGGTASATDNPCGLRAALPSLRMAIFGRRCGKLEELLGMPTIHRLRSTDAAPLSTRGQPRRHLDGDPALPAKRERDRIRHRRGGESGSSVPDLILGCKSTSPARWQRRPKRVAGASVNL